MQIFHLLARIHFLWRLSNLSENRRQNFEICLKVIVHRLKVYHEQTAPIVDYYRTEGSLITISATGAVDEITKRAIAALGNK